VSTVHFTDNNAAVIESGASTPSGTTRANVQTTAGRTTQQTTQTTTTATTTTTTIKTTTFAPEFAHKVVPLHDIFIHPQYVTGGLQ
jgi:hypothetical protein